MGRWTMHPDHDEPCYVISVAARLLDVHPQTLRSYERLGLVSPSRSKGQIRLYSASDIEQLRRIQRLVNELGVNLAGVEVILRLQQRLDEMDRQAEETRVKLEAEIRELRRRLAERESRPASAANGPERSEIEGGRRRRHTNIAKAARR